MRTNSRVLFVLAAFAFGALASAQPAPVAAPAAGKSLAATLNIYVFPSAGQAADQQSKDESECYSWAVAQSGVDPFAQQKAAADQQAQAQQAQQQAEAAGEKKKGGALRGAAAGAIIAKSTGGDGDEGAAIGAVVGKAKQNKEKAAAGQQAQAAAAQGEKSAEVSAATMANFNKAFSVCLEGKKYMVKF